jgi:hypothetical protein
MDTKSQNAVQTAESVNTEIQPIAENTAVEKLAGERVSFFVPNTEELGQLENLKDGFSLTLKYKSADDWAAIKGQPVKCYFMGTKEIPSEKGELVNCGVFVTKKECFIAGAMTLYEAVRNLPYKTPVSITYLGKKQNKSGDGQTMIFDTVILEK